MVSIIGSQPQQAQQPAHAIWKLNPAKHFRMPGLLRQLFGELVPKLRLGNAYPRSSASPRANSLSTARMPALTLQPVRHHLNQSSLPRVVPRARPASVMREAPEETDCERRLVGTRAKRSFGDMRSQAGAWVREAKSLAAQSDRQSHPTSRVMRRERFVSLLDYSAIATSSTRVPAWLVDR